ncbi:MAG TPA: hypothetical protein VGL91_14535 [Acidobacteriota bacterium]|jgi:hypothetical protein
MIRADARLAAGLAAIPMTAGHIQLVQTFTGLTGKNEDVITSMLKKSPRRRERRKLRQRSG